MSTVAARPCCLNNSQRIICDDNVVRVFIPSHGALGQGSVRVELVSDETLARANRKIKQILAKWEAKGITSNLIYSRIYSDIKEAKCWELIPYAPTRNGILGSVQRVWNQIKVLCRVIFGGITHSQVEMDKIAKELNDLDNVELPTHDEARTKPKKLDAFCNQEIIKSHCIFTAKHNHVFYCRSPLQKRHFLIVPKNHVESRAALSFSEIEEAEALAQELTQIGLGDKVKAVYIHDKSGKDAGQAVPHWCKQVIFVESSVKEFFGKLKVFANILLGSGWSKLSDSALKERVHKCKQEFGPRLQTWFKAQPNGTTEATPTT